MSDVSQADVPSIDNSQLCCRHERLDIHLVVVVVVVEACSLENNALKIKGCTSYAKFCNIT